MRKRGERPALAGKAPYLNVSFFVIRTAVFLGLWILFYLLFTRNSTKQDVTRDQSLTRRNVRLAAVFIPVFAVSITFTAIDWAMSLEPHWFSTIYGVYYFSGTVLTAVSRGDLCDCPVQGEGTPSRSSGAIITTAWER